MFGTKEKEAGLFDGWPRTRMVKNGENLVGLRVTAWYRTAAGEKTAQFLASAVFIAVLADSAWPLIKGNPGLWDLAAAIVGLVLVLVLSLLFFRFFLMTVSIVEFRPDRILVGRRWRLRSYGHEMVRQFYVEQDPAAERESEREAETGKRGKWYYRRSYVVKLSRDVEGVAIARVFGLEKAQRSARPAGDGGKTLGGCGGRRGDRGGGVRRRSPVQLGLRLVRWHSSTT